MDSADERRLTFSRPRRFLMVMSLMVIGFYGLDIGVESQAGYGGFALTLGKPERAIVALWLIWMWSIWRYAQLVYDSWNIVRGDLAAAAENEHLLLSTAAGRRVAQKEANNEPGDDKREKLTVDSDFRNTQSPGSDGSTITNYPGYIRMPNGGRVYRFNGRYLWTKKDGTLDSAEFESTMTWTKWRVRRTIIRSWIRSCMRRPAFTQHLSPFVMAAIAAAAPLFLE